MDHTRKMAGLLSSQTIVATSSPVRYVRFAVERGGFIHRNGERREGMGHYIAIAGPADDGTSWWISFADLDGVTSAADGPVDIVI
jgi:hypothetical protein